MWGTVLLSFVSIAALFWLWLNLAPSRRGNLDFRLDSGASPDDAGNPPLPTVAILCPGRNEADMIPTTLPELCGQDYPRIARTALHGEGGEPRGGHRVVYIDDHSDDATPAITADCAGRFEHLIVVRNEQDPPPGWVGKCWAVRQGYAALNETEARNGGARAEWVCFTDADIHWDPRCLRTAMRYALEQQADVVALFPRLVFGSASEALALTTMALGLGVVLPFKKAMDPACKDTITGGAFMLVRRSLYDAIGGHEAVAGCVIEDINLGRKLKGAGGRIRIAVTTTLIYCRMYNGWADMWEGLTKNAYAGAEYKLHWLATFVVGALIAAIAPPIYLAASAAWLVGGGGMRAWAALGLSLLVVLLQARPMNVVRRLLDLPWWYAWCSAIGAAMYTSFMIASAWRYYRGGNTWKGRTYGPATVKAQAAR